MEVPSEKASNEWLTAAEEAYRLLHDADKARTSPGSEVRIRLATGCGAVIEIARFFKYLIMHFFEIYKAEQAFRRSILILQQQNR